MGKIMYEVARFEFQDLFSKSYNHKNDFSFEAINKIFDIIQDDEEDFEFDYEYIKDRFDDSEEGILIDNDTDIRHEL